MPALDRYHQAVMNALIKDAWTITSSPLTLAVEGRSVFVNLGAEKLLAAEKGARRIAVEVKSFIRPSPVNDLQEAMGQFALYEAVLAELEPDRTLYLAVPKAAWDAIFTERIGQIALSTSIKRALIYTTEPEEIEQWNPQP